MRLMLTELRMSSIDMSTSTALRRASDAVDADAEQDGAEQEELVDEHPAPQSRRARTMAPMMAASRTNDRAQNGSR